MTIYKLNVRISKQEDGLWRAEVPSVQGCFVDAEMIPEAIQDIQEVAAMTLDLDLEDGKDLSDVTVPPGEAFEVSIPVIIEEHSFRRVPFKAK